CGSIVEELNAAARTLWNERLLFDPPAHGQAEGLDGPFGVVVGRVYGAERGQRLVDRSARPLLARSEPISILDGSQVRRPEGVKAPNLRRRRVFFEERRQLACDRDGGPQRRPRRMRRETRLRAAKRYEAFGIAKVTRLAQHAVERANRFAPDLHAVVAVDEK